MFGPGGPTFFELAQQALTSTERGYDLLAPKFDTTPFRTPDDLLEQLGSILDEHPVRRSIDVCCGTGAGLRLLHGHTIEEIVGVDVSQGMLEQAAHNLSDLSDQPTLTLRRRDARALDYTEQFDLAVSFGAFGHILPEDEDPFIDSIARALAPGGRFVFVTTRHPTPDQLVWWLAHGFNAAIRLRNLVLKPEFIMYYLTFTWPQIAGKLREHGLTPEIREGAFEGKYRKALVVVATKDD
ncbi:MAG: class I SAM-dependent methyltransferase [Myxococcota bacterium]